MSIADFVHLPCRKISVYQKGKKNYREMAESSDSDEMVNSARAVKLALELHALGLGGAKNGEVESESGKSCEPLTHCLHNF